MSASTATLSNGITQDGQVDSQLVELTAGHGAKIFETIPAESTDLQINLSLDVSALQWVWIKASTAVTLKFNSTESPTPTLTLGAGGIYCWFYGCGLDNKLTVDVTKFYATAAAECELTIRYGVDPTPP